MSNKPAKSQTNDIIIDDGSKVYNIKNKNGKFLGKFEFRPTDTNIIKRYEDVVDFFDNFSAPENTDQAMEVAEKEVIEKISYLVGADSKETFFSILGPFSLLASGEIFVENILIAISNVIEQEMNVRTKKVQRRANKYTAKYHK